MPALFTLPSQLPLSTSGATMAGCTLTFSLTTTSTEQNTYQDVLLATPHANPVVADAAGLFPAIYLDPSLPNYRAVLKTSAGVTLKTWDDVPSNQNTAQQFRLKHTTPALTFEETDGTANNKIWRLKVNGDQLLLTILNDAESVETTVFTFDRTGTTVDQLSFAGQYLRVNGVLVATQESGSFTATLTGFTTAVTGTIKWRRTGSKYTFIAESAITGTSNTTAMTMTGLGAIFPAITIGYQPTVMTDNGAVTVGTARLTTTALVFGVGLAGGNFTNSGTKGLPAGWQFIIDSDQSGIA
jgi:hypothetical protein